MIFERPFLLFALLLVPLAYALAWLARRQRLAAAFAWSRDLGARASALGRRSVWLFASVTALAVIGLAGPRWGTAGANAESRALNLVVVMDVSKSMLAQDVAPNRLGHAVSLARRLVQDLDGDRFALVAFAGHPYLLSPLTLDQSSISLQLDALDPDMASVGGSGLAAALELARHVLTSAPQGGDRAIVVLSDGETFEGTSAMASAGAALRRSGVTLVAIPVGDMRGARIPDPDGGWHHDIDGKVVITVRHDELLRAATDAAHGVFIPAGATDPVGDTRRALAHLNRSVAHDHVAADLVPRAWIFALVAALLLLLQALTRRSAALIAVALMVGGVRTARAQRPSAGTRLLRRGDTVDARAAFAAAAHKESSDTAWFNAGTSALVGGDLPTAISSLERATLSLDPALRQRALYNLGTAYLMQARHDTAQRDTLLASAAAKLRESLLLSPSDRNAKYNYELARRLRPPPPPTSSKSKPGQGNSKSPPPRPQPGRQPSGMTPAQADQVLSAMERAEQQTRQGLNQRARRGELPPGPDW
ncbi:MAG TPA: VWA domain-containing protein [Gemmatimonadales bacterium]|jgi:Ca-activated chloride channel family protein